MFGKLCSRVLILAALLFAIAPLQASADFSYAGKTVRVLVGSSPGGGYDTYARLLARYIGNHLPGNPSVIVENMPGGGGVRVTNYLYEVAAPDGLTFGIVQRAVYLLQLTKASGVHFDLRKMTWVGNITSDTAVLLAMARAGFSNIEDLKSSKKPLILGASGGGVSYVFPRLLQEVSKINIRLITGIESSAERRLAMLRGELDGHATTAGTAFSEFGNEIKKGEVRFLVQTGISTPSGFKRHPDLPDVPTIWEMNLDPDSLSLVKAIVAGDMIFARVFVGPPNIPAEQTTLLRKAFMDTMGDPSLRAEASKTNRPIDPVDGTTLQKEVQEIFKISPSLVIKLKTLLGESK